MESLPAAKLSEWETFLLQLHVLRALLANDDPDIAACEVAWIQYKSHLTDEDFALVLQRARNGYEQLRHGDRDKLVADITADLENPEALAQTMIQCRRREQASA